MKQKLISLGLNDNQATVRLTVWQYGLSPASRIGKITQMERTHAYKILQQLVEMQLIHTSMRGKTTYFYVQDKNVLHSLLDHHRKQLLDQERNLKHLSQELDTLIDPSLSLVPPIRQRTGKNGVQTGLQDCVITASSEHISQITIFGSKTLESLATSSETMGEKRQAFFAELDKQHIHIQGYEGTGILLLENIAGGLISDDIQTLPTGSHALQVIIVGSHLYYLFARREPVMLKISSTEMAELMRILLEKSTTHGQ